MKPTRLERDGLVTLCLTQRYMSGYVPRVLRRLLLVGVLSPVLAVAVATPAHAIARNCAWTVQITGDQVNALFPDEAAKYWIALVPVPEGGKVVLHGRFPHARYTSLNTYNSQTQAIDAIHDEEIAPDAGSANPFTPGADRTVTRRDYTVTVIKGQIPAAGRAPNTLYTVNADGSKSGNMAAIALRIYRTDRGYGIDGGVPLPSVTSYTAQGQQLVKYPDCPDTSVPDTGYTQTLAHAGTGLDVPTPGLLANNPPRWTKYFNTQAAVANIALQSNQLDALGDPAADAMRRIFPSGGFGENVDNKYIATKFSREFGAVMVIKGRMPTFPQTYAGQPRMGTGQLRYWSLCSENQGSQYYACRTDDEVPLAKGREYTIMVSPAASRPANATVACGVQWLPTGPLPQSILLMRNMLPSSSFAQAIQRIEIGKEQAQMGAYYPRAAYYATPGDAERAVGCPTSKNRKR